MTLALRAAGADVGFTSSGRVVCAGGLVGMLGTFVGHWVGPSLRGGCGSNVFTSMLPQPWALPRAALTPP